MTIAFRPSRALLAGTCALFTLSACTDPNYVDGNDPNAKAKQGALIGGLVGAAAGAISGGNAKEKRQNAVKGALLGAGGGAIVGNILDRQEADLRRDLGNDRIGINNTGDRLIVTLPQDITFATDSTTVRSDLQRDLQALAGNLRAYPNSTVQVIGHTDSDGDAAYNVDLSKRRAASVALVLFNAGVPQSRVQTYGRGEDQPVATNLTPEGKAQNRRVEVVILPNAT